MKITRNNLIYNAFNSNNMKKVILFQQIGSGQSFSFITSIKEGTHEDFDGKLVNNAIFYHADILNHEVDPDLEDMILSIPYIDRAKTLAYNKDTDRFESYKG